MKQKNLSDTDLSDKEQGETAMIEGWTAVAFNQMTAFRVSSDRRDP